VTDLDSASFWAALRQHRVVLQRCDGCGRMRFPPVPGCPYCGATLSADVEVDGRGRLYSWVRVHRVLAPGGEGDVPYTVGVVQLDAGPRMLGRFDGPARIGATAEPSFLDHADRTELRWQVS
jgi:uncharacterized OB-fold protein